MVNLFCQFKRIKNLHLMPSNDLNLYIVKTLIKDIKIIYDE
jgi:hypothetical protein